MNPLSLLPVVDGATLSPMEPQPPMGFGEMVATFLLGSGGDPTATGQAVPDDASSETTDPGEEQAALETLGSLLRLTSTHRLTAESPAPAVEQVPTSEEPGMDLVDGTRNDPAGEPAPTQPGPRDVESLPSLAAAALIATTGQSSRPEQRPDETPSKAPEAVASPDNGEDRTDQAGATLRPGDSLATAIAGTLADASGGSVPHAIHSNRPAPDRSIPAGDQTITPSEGREAQVPAQDRSAATIDQPSPQREVSTPHEPPALDVVELESRPTAAARLDAADVAAAPPTASAGQPGAAGLRTPAHVPSSLVSRVERAVEMIEQAPPPRQITIEADELNGLRVTVALRPDGIALSSPTADRGVLNALEQALQARGFDLSGSNDRRRRQEHSDDLDTWRPDTAGQKRPEARPAGIRL